MSYESASKNSPHILFDASINRPNVSKNHGAFLQTMMTLFYYLCKSKWLSPTIVFMHPFAYKCVKTYKVCGPGSQTLTINSCILRRILDLSYENWITEFLIENTFIRSILVKLL